MKVLFVAMILATAICANAEDLDLKKLKAIAAAPQDKKKLPAELAIYPRGTFITKGVSSSRGDPEMLVPRIVETIKHVQGKYVVFRLNTTDGKLIQHKVIAYDKSKTVYTDWTFMPSGPITKFTGKRVAGKDAIAWTGKLRGSVMKITQTFVNGSIVTVTKTYQQKRFLGEMTAKSTLLKIPAPPPERAKQKADALVFMKECVRKVKRRDKSVLKVITDANVLFDAEALITENGKKPIDWSVFGGLEKLTDDQIKNFEKIVMTLREPGFSKAILTDKRHGKDKERKVPGLYIWFNGSIDPKFQSLFRNRKSIGFGVYIIEGKQYWEPFGW